MDADNSSSIFVRVPDDSLMRRYSADSQVTKSSRRASSDVSSRLEVELRSRITRLSTATDPESPSPFPPYFTDDLNKDVEAVVGDALDISCAVHGHPKPELAWHKDGVLLTHNSHGMELWSQGHMHKLVIPFITQEHSGIYCVVAVNPLGRSESHCVIRVVDDPEDSGLDTPLIWPTALSAHALDCCAAGCHLAPEFLSLFRDQFCRAGEPMTLECEVSAWPAPLVTWSFNGQPIQSEDHHFQVSSQGQRHRLSLSQVTFGDAGRICFTAENDAGAATCGALIIVEDPNCADNVCNQKVIRLATKLFNKRPDQPTEAWQSTPSYSLVV